MLIDRRWPPVQPPSLGVGKLDYKNVNSAEALSAWVAGTDVYLHGESVNTELLALLTALQSQVVALGYGNSTAEQYAAAEGKRVGGPSPRNSLQWWRLRACWEMLLEHEARCARKHDFIFKLRADLVLHTPRWMSGTTSRASLLSLFGTLPQSEDAAAGAAWIASDYAYGTTHTTMQRIARFYDRIEVGEFYHAHNRCFAFDPRLLVSSDWDTHGPCLLKYNWLVFPQPVFDALEPKSCLAVSRNVSILRDALQHALAKQPELRCPTSPEDERQHPSGSCFPVAMSEQARGFSSEKQFLVHLLSCGVRIRKWPGNVVLGTHKNGCWGEGRAAHVRPMLAAGRMVD